MSHQSSGNKVDDKDPDFEPDPSPKWLKMVTKEPLQNPSKVERQLCVCESSQIVRLIEDVNKTSRCSTPDCNGMCHGLLNCCRFIFFRVALSSFRPEIKSE